MGRFSGMEISSSQGWKNPHKLALGKKNLASRGPTALGRTRFFALGLIFEDFSTRGMKKFSYLKTTAHSEIVFL